MIIQESLAGLVKKYDWDKDLLKLIGTEQELMLNELYFLPTKTGEKELSIQLESDEKEYFIPIKCLYYCNINLNRKINILRIKNKLKEGE